MIISSTTMTNRNTVNGEPCPWDPASNCASMMISDQGRVTWTKGAANSWRVSPSRSSGWMVHSKKNGVQAKRGHPCQYLSPLDGSKLAELRDQILVCDGCPPLYEFRLSANPTRHHPRTSKIWRSPAETRKSAPIMVPARPYHKPR